MVDFDDGEPKRNVPNRKKNKKDRKKWETVRQEKIDC